MKIVDLSEEAYFGSPGLVIATLDDLVRVV
jgi:hypothetical protein